MSRQRGGPGGIEGPVSALELPHVDAVGVVHVPADYRGSAHPHPWPMRVAAAALLAVFLGVGTATTVATLGRWCLTSQAGSPVPTAAGKVENPR